MIGSSKNETTTEVVQATYNVKVLKVKAVKQGTYAFDMVVNGITIYGCWYREGIKNGKEWSIISFPSHKGNNDKYYNHVFFPISDDLKSAIVKQMESLLG